MKNSGKDYDDDTRGSADSVSPDYDTPKHPALRRKSAVSTPDTIPDARLDLLQQLVPDVSDELELQQPDLPAPVDLLEVLVFELAGERYGMDIQKVYQIIRFIEPTPVPHTVSFLDGIISLRGKMIPVLNARKRLGHEPALPGKKTRIIVLKDGAEYQGILVDSTTQVVRLPREAIEPTPPVVVGIEAEFIEGICEHRGRLIILLNLERFLQI